jgi:capsular exopolysaccharide synthesis family protein
MPTDDSFLLSASSEKPHKEDIVNLKQIFSLMVSRWYYFLIALIMALICALLYIRYANPVYRVSATLLIDQEKKGISAESNQILQGFGLGESAQNLDNQIMVLSSKTLIGRTLDELPFYIEYYYRRLNNKVTLYPKSPIKIIPETADSLPRDIEFTFKYLGNNMFNLDAESNDFFDLNTTASFGEDISTPGGRFRIELSDTIWPLKNEKNELQFIFHDRRNLIESYRNRMSVEKTSRTGTIVELSLEGTNRIMDIEFLNKLCEIFLYNSLEKKNEEAVRTIQFIDDQLIGISDSLVITENKLQQFRSRNKVMNLSAQGQVIIDQAMNLENQKARLGVEANYYNYLADYLSKDNVGQAPIAPATMGITDPGLTRLVTDLADIQGQFYSKSLGEKNPLQSQLAQRLRNTKEALRETLNGVRRSNNMAMNEITEQIRTVNAQATALPVTERQLLGIERKYKLNDELYTFLLEKRAGAQIQKASNMPDNEVIDTSEADFTPVKPKRQLIYLFAIVAGLGLPFLWILFADPYDKKVRENNDIKKITDSLISGHIPHSDFKKNTVVLEESNSQTAEAFRSLRSRMQYFIKETKTPAIIITSSMPEEGKTFTAINLAAVYSLMGKKTVLVDFDLRKPKIHTDFGLGNENGVSTWLTGKDSLENIIKETAHKNLFVIPGGPIPPNPSELIALEKTDELLRLLKEKFECIIIDSSPVGTVSDAFPLVTLADICILIVRQNMTLKDILENTINELKASDIKGLSIIVNDLGPEYKRYRYDGKYGYTYEKNP